MKVRGRSWILGATLVVVSAWTLAAFAAVRVDVLSSPKDATPGQVVTHVFAVTHDGTAATTFTLAAGAPAGWTILGVPPEITVGPGEESVVFVTLTVPADAIAGLAVVTLRATSTVDPTDDASAGVATQIAVVNRIELTPPAGGSLPPGGSLSYSIRVTNRGNAQDVVATVAASSRGYEVTPSAMSVELAPQETRDIVVSVFVPADAGPGRDVLTVRATSTLHTGVEDEIAVFTTILPPGPDAVGGSLFEVLPARLTFGVERDETAGTFDSRAAVSVTGTVFDGVFAASATALHPFGPEPVDVTAYSLAYRIDRSSFAVGTVSQSLTDLHSIACDGGSGVLDTRFVDAALIAGGADGETRFGGRLVAGPEQARIGFAYSDRRDLATRAAAWTGLAQAEPLAGWTLRTEGGRGTSGGKTGRAAFVGTIVDSEPYFLSAAAFSVGTYFPGPRQDRAGIEASQRLRLDNLSLGLSLGHVWDNVIRDPLVPTLVTDSLGVNVSATPWSDGPTFQGTVNFERKHQSNGSPRDDVGALLAYHIGDGQGSFPYAFSGRIADRIDLVLGTRERTMTHTQEVGLSVEGLSLSLRLSEEQTVDLVRGITLASGGSASLIVRPAGAAHEGSIEFRSSAGNRLDLRAAFMLHPVEDLSVSLGGFATWERGDPTEARFGWSLDVDAALGIPLPFLVTKGRIHGRVFVDRNANGLFDAGESPAVDAVVFLEEGEVSTNAQGEYRFPPLAPRRYALNVRELPLDAASPGPLAATVIPGRELEVNIPLAPILRIRGAVFGDANQDGIRQSGEAGFADVRVVFVDGAGVTSSTTSDARGDFVLADARPGLYVLSLDARTLPERFSYTTAESQSVAAGAETPVLFGGYIHPRPVVVTFQPPTADIAYAPAAPRVGEPVTFDASASFDFDGTLVSFAWDFDADGVIDSPEPVASYVFAAPGPYRVSLTVTDNAGNSDTQVIDVVVATQPAQGEAAPSASPSSALPSAPPPAAARPPVADYAYAPVAPTAGQVVAFDAAASVDFDGGIVRFAWDFDGDGAVDAEGSTARWAFAAAGAHDVALTVTDATGLTDIAVYSVDVAAPQTAQPALEVPRAEFAYTPAAPRAGEVVRFDASASTDPSGSDLAYAWDFGGDGTPDAVERIAEWTFAAAGSYSVTLAVVTADGRLGMATQAVAVLASSGGAAGGQPPIAVIEVAPTRPAAGELVLFSSAASADFDGHVVAAAWDFTSDGLVDSTQVTAATTYSNPGEYVVTLTVYDDAGNSDTVTATITVE